jgi:hypothetical protein
MLFKKSPMSRIAVSSYMTFRALFKVMETDLRKKSRNYLISPWCH